MLLAVVCASKDVFSCYSYVEKKRHCLHTKYKILSLCPNVASSALLVPNQNQSSDFDEKRYFLQPLFPVICRTDWVNLLKKPLKPPPRSEKKGAAASKQCYFFLSPRIVKSERNNMILVSLGYKKKCTRCINNRRRWRWVAIRIRLYIIHSCSLLHSATILSGKYKVSRPRLSHYMWVGRREEHPLIVRRKKTAARNINFLPC